MTFLADCPSIFSLCFDTFPVDLSPWCSRFDVLPKRNSSKRRELGPKRCGSPLCPMTGSIVLLCFPRFHSCFFLSPLSLDSFRSRENDGSLQFLSGSNGEIVLSAFMVPIIFHKTCFVHCDQASSFAAYSATRRFLLHPSSSSSRLDFLVTCRFKAAAFLSSDSNAAPYIVIYSRRSTSLFFRS